MSSVECVMLAAGSSSRMERWKMMMPWGGSTIIEHSVKTALGVCDRLVLVVGFRARELRAVFEGWSRVEVVENPRFQEGMFSSVRRGVQAAEGTFFLSLGDMPGVEGGVYADLLDWSARLSPGFDSADCPFAVIPQYRGKKGHPLFLSDGMRVRILEADASNTLRDVLAGVPTVIVPVNEGGILHDIDTPQDYRFWGPTSPPR
jgi:molybdenum cofactor cytidylyltransferase